LIKGNTTKRKRRTINSCLQFPAEQTECFCRLNGGNARLLSFAGDLAIVSDELNG